MEIWAQGVGIYIEYNSFDITYVIDRETQSIKNKKLETQISNTKPQQTNTQKKKKLMKRGGTTFLVTFYNTKYNKAHKLT